MDLDVLLLRLEVDKWQDVSTFDKYSPCVQVKTSAQAEAHLRACAEHIQRRYPSLGMQAALRLERSKIGYFSGYYDLKVRQRVEQLYQCVHPTAGPSSIHGQRKTQFDVISFPDVCQVIDLHKDNLPVPFGCYMQPPWHPRTII